MECQKLQRTPVYFEVNFTIEKSLLRRTVISLTSTAKVVTLHDRESFVLTVFITVF